jgi:hypothetical protein
MPCIPSSSLTKPPALPLPCRCHSTQATDDRVRGTLEAAGLSVRSFEGYLLRDPAAVRIDLGKWAGHFGTLMPFYR